MLKRNATVADLLRQGHRALRTAGSDSPGLDAEILLREALGLSREQLFEALQYPVRGGVSESFDQMIEQRCAGVPVAYITGRKEFYGHEFSISHAVLVPRPETEYLIEWSAAWLSRDCHKRCRVVDVGAGSGAIAASLALQTAGAHHVIASEISREALAVASENCQRLDALVDLVAGSLLEWCVGPVDLIIANLPYLRLDQAHPGIAHEPELALFAGSTGFELNDRLLQQATALLSRPGGLIVEIDPDQSDLARTRASTYFPDDAISIEQDLAGLARYLIIQRS